jgi:S-(hydroxymethyl)glutathione dehydrogenase/alcohol dehydrogenase
VLADGSLRLTRPDGTEVHQYLSLGTFAEKAVVPAAAVVKVPDSIPFDVASLIGCGVSTGVGAVLNTAGVEAGASVCILGCGGVGLSLVMGAVLAGADPIVAVDLADARLAQARELGATHAVRAAGNVRREVVTIVPGGVDYAFEAIGLRETIELMPRLTTSGGACVMVGMTPDDVAVSVNGMLFPATGQRLLGSSYGSSVAARDFPRYAELYLEGRLPIDRLITHRIALDEVGDALAAMRRRERARSVIVY